MSFIGEVASDPERENGRLYSLVAVVETYFEFICRVFLGKFKGKGPKQGKSIKKLRKRRIIDDEAKNIMQEVKKVRDDMLHNLFYAPDIEQLRTFKKKCFDEDLNPGDEYICRDQDHLEQIFSSVLTKAYTIIANKYKDEVDRLINTHLKSL